MTQNFNLAEIAIEYSKMGRSVLPMKPGSKIPYTKWKPYQTQRATPAKIRQFWKIWPNAQIGIVTGKISNLVAIDFDSPEALERFEALVCGFPGTIVQRTGRENGGCHYLFQYPSDGTVLTRWSMVSMTTWRCHQKFLNSLKMGNKGIPK